MNFNLKYFPEVRFYEIAVKNAPSSPERERWIADTLSPYSANLELTKLKMVGLPNDARSCLAYLLAVYIDLPAEYDYLRSLVLNKIVRAAFSQKFEGKWFILKEVYDLPEDEPFDFTSIFHEVLLRNFSENEIFGNILPAVVRYLRFFRKMQNWLPYVTDKHRSKIKKKVRKRGYDDKGATILYNQSGAGTSVKNWQYTGPNPEKDYYLERFPTCSPTNYMWLGGAG